MNLIEKYLGEAFNLDKYPGTKKKLVSSMGPMHQQGKARKEMETIFDELVKWDDEGLKRILKKHGIKMKSVFERYEKEWYFDQMTVSQLKELIKILKPRLDDVMKAYGNIAKG